MEHDFRDWSEQLTRFVAARLGSSHVAEEIAQEAISRFLDQQRQSGPIRRPRAWLFRTARNLCVDYVRRRLPHPIGLDALALLRDHRDDFDDESFPTRVGEVTRSSLLLDLPGALALLAPQDREVLILRYQSGLSCSELAGQQGITLENAKVRLHRARRRLRRVLESRVTKGGLV